MQLKLLFVILILSVITSPKNLKMKPNCFLAPKSNPNWTSNNKVMVDLWEKKLGTFKRTDGYNDLDNNTKLKVNAHGTMTYFYFFILLLQSN